MKKSEFDRLTDQMEDAHNEFMGFMDTFVFAVDGRIRKARTPKRCMTAEDQSLAADLYRRKQELEERWLNFVRSPEPVEED